MKVVFVWFSIITLDGKLCQKLGLYPGRQLSSTGYFRMLYLLVMLLSDTFAPLNELAKTLADDLVLNPY